MPTLQEIQQFFLSNPSPQEIAAAMAAHPEVTTAKIASAMQVGTEDVKRVLNNLPQPILTPPPSPAPGGNAPRQTNPALGQGVYQAYSPVRGGGNVGDSSEMRVDQIPNSDPLINGVQYRNIEGFANNSPDPQQALQQEIAHLRQFGLEPINHPQYGWIVPDGPQFNAAHDPTIGNRNSIFDYGPFILGGGMAALSAGLGAGAAGTYSTLGGEGAIAGGAGALGTGAAPWTDPLIESAINGTYTGLNPATVSGLAAGDALAGTSLAGATINPLTGLPFNQFVNLANTGTGSVPYVPTGTNPIIPPGPPGGAPGNGLPPGGPPPGTQSPAPVQNGPTTPGPGPGGSQPPTSGNLFGLPNGVLPAAATLLGALGGSQTQGNQRNTLPEGLINTMASQAALTPDDIMAGNYARNIANGQFSNIAKGQELQNNVLSGQYLDPRTNPAIQGQLQALQDQFMTQTLPSTMGAAYKWNQAGPLTDNSTFLNPSVTGGGMLNTAAQNLGRGFGQAVSQGYTGERTNQMNAMNSAFLNNPASTLFGIGTAQRQPALNFAAAMGGNQPVFSASPFAGAVMGGLGGLAAANQLFGKGGLFGSPT